MADFIYIDNLSFTYNNSVEPLFDSLSVQLQKGWTAIVGANGSGKSTFLKLLTGELKPDQGTINIPADSLYCEQRTDFMPPDFESFISSNDKNVFRLKKILEINDDWISHWQYLSHGERKRCQIAVALSLNPAVLAADEPSNHLDAESRNFILEAFRTYRGIGLLVSHDRDLMDRLCQHTLFFTSPGMDLRKCSFSIAEAERQKELEARFREQEYVKKETKKLKTKVRRQREQADQADKNRSKRNINLRDHDAKSKKDLARLSGKDALAGRQHKRLKNKLNKSLEYQKKIRLEKKTNLGIFIHEEKNTHFFPLILPSQTLKLGSNKKLNIPELSLEYGEKIGLIGKNGTGKSTFIKHVQLIVEKFGHPFIFIPQEISADQSGKIIQRIQDYDRNKKGQLLTIIKRLGSDPVRVLETEIPSPGEMRKLLLAEGIMLNPGTILMDEPTNHMDLPSIECVEQALQECGCAQLLISHDRVFLGKIVKRVWEFKNHSMGQYSITEKNAI